MRKRICVMLVLCLCIGMCMAVSAQSAETITAISFPNDNAVPEENLSVSGYGDKDSGYAPSMLGGRLYASVSGTDLRKLEWSKGEYQGVGMQPVMTGGTKNPWGSGAYLEVRVSTAGYENITFSASIGATKKGPRDYKLQYSSDGVTFTDIAGQFFTIPANKTMYQAFDSVALPAAASDADMLYIRIAVASNMMVGGTAGLIGGTGGETAVNNIVVSGTPLPTQTTAQAEQTTDGSSDGTTATSATASVNGSSAADASVQSTTTVATPVESVNTGENTVGALFAAILLLVTAGGMVCLNRIKA